jgi:hypothetical protein
MPGFRDLSGYVLEERLTFRELTKKIKDLHNSDFVIAPVESSTEQMYGVFIRYHWRPKSDNDRAKEAKRRRKYGLT